MIIKNGTDNIEQFKEQYKALELNFPEKMEEVNNAIKILTQDLIQKADDFIDEVSLKLRLSEVTEVVSLSYIAKKYFNHSKNWLYQRINGNIVKGKPAKFYG